MSFPRRQPRTVLVGCLLAVLAMMHGCAPRESAVRSDPSGVDAGATATPRNVILLLSDGAGAAHWTLATFAQTDPAIGEFRTVGLVDTRGVDHVVSGSAPTATAYATGVRTFMGAVGVGPDSLPRRNVVEVAMERGMRTGVISTTAITDATPAAFTAHVVSRREMPEIARQQFDAGLTVLMGGGRVLFGPDFQPEGRDLIGEARARGAYAESLEELRTLDADTVQSLIALLADGPMGIVEERGEDALVTMASTALDVLGGDPDGFFLVVENEESDEQSHANAPESVIIAEMLDFDRLVRRVLDYRARHPETLVLVTGDHETGGLSLGYVDDARRSMRMSWSSDAHTGTLIPLFAEGPGAERFGGIIRNDEVGRILLELIERR